MVRCVVLGEREGGDGVKRSPVTTEALVFVVF